MRDPGGPARARGTLIREASNSGLEGRGIEEFRLLAAQGYAPAQVLEQAFRTVHDASPRFSHRQWGTVLRRAIDRAERHGPSERRRGAAVSLLIDRMQADHAAGWRPASLAFYAHWLDCESRACRRANRAEKREAIAA